MLGIKLPWTKRREAREQAEKDAAAEQRERRERSLALANQELARIRADRLNRASRLGVLKPDNADDDWTWP